MLPVSLIYGNTQLACPRGDRGSWPGGWSLLVDKQPMQHFAEQYAADTAALVPDVHDKGASIDGGQEAGKLNGIHACGSC